MNLKGKSQHDIYWQKRLEAKALYASLGKVWCSALDDWVVFNMKGFNHLIRKAGILRPEKDQIRRFSLLKHLVLIIVTSSDFDNYKKEETAEFWTLRKEVEGKVVKVVIRQLLGSNKHFFSIMDNT